MSSPFGRCRDYDERATAISTRRSEYADLLGGRGQTGRVDSLLHIRRARTLDEDRWRPGLEVHVGRKAADVPAVAHRPEREQCDQRVLGGMERAEQPPLGV